MTGPIAMIGETLNNYPQLIARHGSTAPGAAPRNVPAGATTVLGAINMVVSDGHVESVKLWDLNRFHWTGVK